jgi:hypothetical protein
MNAAPLSAARHAMPGISDTSPEIERRLIEAYRCMPAWRKWRNLCDEYRMARSLHTAGMQHRHPGATAAEIQTDWLTNLLEEPCPVCIPENLVDPLAQDFQEVLRYVIRTLDRLGIPYAIGGSLASSMHGVQRMTRDADLTVEPFPRRIESFLAYFDTEEYYVSEDAVREALRNRSTFNVIHPASGYKIDFFVRKDEPFEREAFTRRTSFALPDHPNEPVVFHSAEDVIVFKLRWYRMGGEQSEKQWTDILNVLKVQADRLNETYLDQWAASLNVADLLQRARGEV